MQRTVLEENILYQALIDVGIDNLTRTHHIIQREIMFDDNQGSYLLFAHTDASHHHRHDFLMLHILFLISGKEAHQRAGMLVRTKRQQKTPYFVLKQNNQCNHSHAHQLVKDGTEQLHLQYLGYHQPYQYEYQNTRKHIDGTGSLHQLIRIVKQKCNQQNVDNIFYANIKKHGL